MPYARKKELLDLSTDISEVVIAGPLTNPRTYGVYRVGLQTQGSYQFRFGNHPIREWELRREFDNVSLVALFKARTLAKELKSILNREG